LFVGCSCPPLLFVTLLHFSRDRSTRSSPSCSNITFENFQAFLIYFLMYPNFTTIQGSVPKVAHY
jgi:hypothetical protein